MRALRRAATPGRRADGCWKILPMKNLVVLSLVAVAVLGAANLVSAQDDGPATGHFESRFRWGFTAGGGPLTGGYSGGAGGMDARFGMQLTPLLGVYAQPILMIGGGSVADAQGVSATGLVLPGVGVLADLTLADMVFVAAGPQILFGEIGNPEATTATGSAAGANGPFLSVAARAGIVLGSRSSEGRSGFSLGLDMHVVMAKEVAILPMVFLGYERY